jgi:hypothetical protein
MALYSTTNTSATTPAQTNVAASPGKTMLQVAAATATLRRAFVYEFEVGADGAPNATDCAIVWHALLQSTAGTGGVTMTIVPLDPADAATGSVALGNFSAEPTGTFATIRWSLGANQRASYRWVVNPGGPGELTIPATNLTGIGIRAQSPTYASTASVCMFFRE